MNFIIWMLLAIFFPELYGTRIEATGKETKRSKGYAVAEAKFAAVEELRRQCYLKEGDTITDPTYDDPSCTSYNEGEVTYWECTVDASAYCYKQADVPKD